MNCIVSTKRKTITLKENNKSVVFGNEKSKKVDIGKVDGCLIDDGRERCDHFVRIPDTIWLVELKGRHSEKAVSQIISTIDHLAAEIGDRDCVPVIITSKSPAIANKQKALLGFRKCNGVNLNKIVLKTRKAIIPIA